MQLKDKIAVVTGAGSGIGKALVDKFITEGAATVIAVDINEHNVKKTAQHPNCKAMTADVTREADIIRVIEETEANYGKIDLFCSNAGILTGASEQASLDQRQQCWDVNVMSQVLAARHLAPKMIARGDGYFLHTASAAGLLNQIGVAAYGVSKHAAVGFAEWLCTQRYKGLITMPSGRAHSYDRYRRNA